MVRRRLVAAAVDAAAVKLLRLLRHALFRNPTAGFLVTDVALPMWCPGFAACGPFEVSLRTVNSVTKLPTLELLTDELGHDAAATTSVPATSASGMSLVNFHFASPVPVAKETLVAVYLKPTAGATAIWVEREYYHESAPFQPSGWVMCAGQGWAAVRISRSGCALARARLRGGHGATMPRPLPLQIPRVQCDWWNGARRWSNRQPGA